MVRAILAGQKTVTRRVVKPQPKTITEVYLDNATKTNVRIADNNKWLDCPFGTVGDILWVKETWCEKFVCDEDSTHGYCYRASYQTYSGFANEPKWNSTIHMPREASRILLKVVSVGVERLHKISDNDAWAEGVHFMAKGVTRFEGEAILLFKELWNGIYKDKEGCTWGDNPWVWRIEFERISQ
jgi:hypothetical protein